MDTAGTTPATAEAAGGPGELGPSAGAQRDAVALQDRQPVARHARAVWALGPGVPAISPVAAPRGGGARAGGLAARGGRAGAGGLDAALRRRQRGARAPACGGGKKGGGEQALGRSRGGFSTKLHVRVERCGKPITFTLTGGERHEQIALPTLMETGAIKRPGRGRPRLRPDRVAGDKGYSSRKARAYLRRRG